MKNKIIIFMLATCTLFASKLVAQTITDVHTLSITPYTQEQSQWCWAGCTRMVDWSYSSTTPPSQCTYVNKANAQCAAGSCCSTLDKARTTACSNPVSSNYPNNVGSCNGSLSWLLAYYAGANTYASGAKTYSTVSSNLTAKKMMVARWGWTSGGGHVVVIYGCYQFNYVGQVSYANPSNGSKVTESISYFTSNTSRDWTHTITMNGATARRLRSPDQIIEDVKSSVSLYPNPSNGVVHFERVGAAESSVDVKIMNSLGQLISDFSIESDLQSYDLDLKSKAGTGIYFVNMIVDGESATSRLIVQ